MMKTGTLGLFFSAVLLLSGAAFAGTADCVDGTKHFKCSTVTPGLLCNDGHLIQYVSYCPCSKMPGWVQQGEGETASCVQAKCSDGTDSGKCALTKPKQCTGGALVDNATACGCPSGKKASANGLSCDFLPCTDNGVNVPEGLCSPKTSGKKCVNGQLVDKASDCPCKSGTTKQGETCVVFCEDSTKSGDCSASKPKECVLSETGVGVLLDNAAKCGCPEGKVADGKRCTSSASAALGGAADLLGGTAPAGNSSQPPSSGGTGAFSCACCPAAVIGLLLIGFVACRKNE
jgi:hypothetical protein